MRRAILSGLLWASLTTLLVPAGAVQLYRTPVAPQITPRDLALSCIELDREITALTPLTYSYKPGFYDNPYQGGSLFLGTLFSPWFYLFPAYDYYLDYREQARMIPAEERIETLLRLKADRHCFDS
ncbi:MAG TPA: hypothetical protein ENI96_04545 [Sedimenticola thiotaurini]|uniref:Uncharacterized protein n=1 Tax=Sedimenticola thiotaurini TaxID=1543721 RepID=A0A831RML5_9GAMM|nr:hypothetical protein [Sedimenticola thiotaurini]